MTASDHRRYDRLRADRAIIDEAAMWLRHDAFQEQYAGFQRKERALAVAGLLDTISRHLDTVPGAVRADAVATSEVLTDERGMSPRFRRSR